MKFIIHFECSNGDEDSFLVEGETIEEIREKADFGVKQRGGRNPWSEEVN